MKAKTIVKMTALASALCWAGVSQAAITLSAGQVKFKLEDFEQFLPGVTAQTTTFQAPPPAAITPGTYFQDGTPDLRGVFNITQVIGSSGTQSFPGVAVSGVQNASESLTGVFYGFDSLYSTADPTKGTDSFGYTGGHLAIYVNSNPVDFTRGPGGFGATDSVYNTITGGTLWLSADFVPGFDVSSTGPTGATLYGSINPHAIGTPDANGNCTAGFNNGAGACVALDGNSQAFMHVTGGLVADRFTPGVYGGNRDLVLGNHFGSEGNFNFIQNGFNWGWNYVSDDPATGTIPEPGTVALMAVAMGGLAGAVRLNAKKKAKNA
ncbi:MAG: PEP-CTERM sorting domain-containing protein [Gammaproteobacteria bacterium]